MAVASDRIRVGLVLFIVVSTLACPLALAYQSMPSQAYAAAPFETLQPVQPNIGAVFTATPPLPTLLSTVGPGHYFEQADANRPEVGEVHGNDEFGWGEVKGQPELVAMWVTDDEGTHYIVVSKTSDEFLGTPDPRIQDGFDDYISQMEGIETKRLETAAAGIGSGVAVGILALGLGLCPATGGGGCVVGVVGGIAVAIGGAVTEHIILAGLNRDLRSVQSYLNNAFIDAVASTQP